MKDSTLLFITLRVHESCSQRRFLLKISSHCQDSSSTLRYCSNNRRNDTNSHNATTILEVLRTSFVRLRLSMVPPRSNNVFAYSSVIPIYAALLL